MTKKAILVISFGTSYINNLKLTIQAVEEITKQEFPEYEVRRAFTSKVIIKCLANRDGIYINDVNKALEKLAGEGFKEVYCLSTHIMNGLEYDKLINDISRFENKFDIIKISRPLISVTSDYQNLINALTDAIVFDKSKYYIFMGHGTTHFANSVYCALDYHFKNNDFDNVYIGTVEGFPELEDIIKKLSAKPKKEIVLIPLMLVAGDHVNNDMAGDEPDSWKSILINNGYSITCVMKGLGEYSQVRQLYIKHLLDIM